MDDDEEKQEKNLSSQDNLIQFLEKVLNQARVGTFTGIVGVLFDDDCEDYYFTAGFTPRTAIIGGLTLLLDDLKERASDLSATKDEDTEIEEDTIPEPEIKTLN